MPATPVRHLLTAILLGGGAVGLVSTISLLARPQAAPSASSSPASMSELAALEPIDTHAHAYQAVPGLADLLTSTSLAHPERPPHRRPRSVREGH